MISLITDDNLTFKKPDCKCGIVSKDAKTGIQNMKTRKSMKSRKQSDKKSSKNRKLHDGKTKGRKSRIHKK